MYHARVAGLVVQCDPNATDVQEQSKSAGPKFPTTEVVPKISEKDLLIDLCKRLQTEETKDDEN